MKSLLPKEFHVTSTSRLSRITVLVAVLVGGAVGRISVDLLQVPLPLIGSGLLRAAFIVITCLASTAVTAAVGLFAYARIVRCATAWHRQLWPDRTDADDLNPPSN